MCAYLHMFLYLCIQSLSENSECNDSKVNIIGNSFTRHYELQPQGDLPHCGLQRGLDWS